MKFILIVVLTFLSTFCTAQRLKLKYPSSNALSGSAFSESLRDSSLSLDEGETIIYKEIRSGNIPAFYRNLVEIRDSAHPE